MKIIIDIPKEEYENIKKTGGCYYDFGKAIANGIPLPKGHGRLFDEKDIINAHDNYELGWLNLEAVKPILEEDKEEVEG